MFEKEYDVIIVGGGPSGLATAIKLKQLNMVTLLSILAFGKENLILKDKFFWVLDGVAGGK